MTAIHETTVVASRSSVDIAQAEAEADRLEAAVHAEAARLQGLRSEVEAWLSRARTVVTDPGLRRFIESVAVKAPALDEHQQEARAARQKAVAVRKASAKAMAAQLDAHQAELERLSERLREEEAAARQRQAQKAQQAAAEERAAAAKKEVEQAHVVSASMASAVTTHVAAEPAFKPTAVTKDERRVAQRISLCTEISFHSDSNFFTGFTNDISEGGVFMATMNVMPVGTEVEVSFTLPGGRKVEAKGEVRWVRELDERDPNIFPGMGIRFTQVPASCVEAIHQFAVEREPMFFPEN